VSDEAKAYKEECGWRAKLAGVREPMMGPVEVRFRLVPANRVCMDLDNALKVSIDALKGIVFADDSQVYRLVAERADPDPQGGARLEVEVLPLVMPTALELAA
jgi:crossover junction endodeoxyribonuclease RusA